MALVQKKFIVRDLREKNWGRGWGGGGKPKGDNETGTYQLQLLNGRISATIS